MAMPPSGVRLVGLEPFRIGLNDLAAVEKQQPDLLGGMRATKASASTSASRRRRMIAPASTGGWLATRWKSAAV